MAILLLLALVAGPVDAAHGPAGAFAHPASAPREAGQRETTPRPVGARHGEAAQAGASHAIPGTVADATLLPLPGATIEVDGRIVAVSGERGEFAIELDGRAPRRLRVALDGFDPHESIVDPDATHLHITLHVAGFQDRVSVAARAPRRPADAVITRQPIDVHRTPGAQGDLFRALQTLPGVSTPDDSAGLFVRGGDVSETLVVLDDAVIAHPYRYETPTGGFRGAIDPLLVTGIGFSAGGFSARHGNALSAIVDLQGLGRPEVPELAATVGLAGASASIGAPAGDRAGWRAAANRTFTGLLFAVNGSPRRFDPAPEGWDGSASVSLDLGRAGRLKTFVMIRRDEVGVETEQDAFSGWLESSNRHAFAAAHWDGALGSWAAAATLGDDSYVRRTVVGVLDLDVEERTQSWRLEATRSGGSHVDWRVGVNGGLSRTGIEGRVPVHGGDLGGVSGDMAFDVLAEDWFAGMYSEATMTAGIVSVTPGVRVDRFDRAGATTVDPRLNVRMAFAEAMGVRYATGIYHQAPAASYYDRIRGAGELPPMRAVHHVVGIERGREAEGFFLRVEGYAKRYRHLPVESDELGYSSQGYGWSNGVDAFWQWRTSALDIRAMASWLRARRRWTPVEQRSRYPLPEGSWRPDFEIPWSAQIVASVPIGRGAALAASWRSAAGRPHTAIVGALPSGDRLTPVFGAVNSERLPRYERLDVAVNWLVPAGPGALVLFLSLDNALGRANFFDYRYAPDYSSRRPVTSTAQRSLYVGATFRR